MIFILNFPLFLIVASLACSVISTLLKEKAAALISKTLVGISFLCNLSIVIYTGFSGKNFVYQMGHFPHPWGNELKIGFIESLIIALFTLSLFLILIGGKDSLTDQIKQDKRNLYYCLIDLIHASLLVLAYTYDIFTGYVFVEICTLASVGIICIKGDGKAIVASLRYLVFALIGSGLFLFGIVYLYNITGHLLMPDLKESIALLWQSGSYRLPLLTAICFISLGISIKSGLFPFHFWMADTYGCAAATSASILSGIISKSYIFLLIKIIYDVFSPDIFFLSGADDILLVLGLCGIIVGSISASKEKDLFKMCAYSSAAQIAYIYMGIGLGNELAICASLFQICAHCLTKPVLFLTAFSLFKINGSSYLPDLKGSSKKDLFTCLIFCEAAFSMIGIPLTAGFMSKFLFSKAAFMVSGWRLYSVLAVLAISTILNTLYFTRALIILFLNDGKKEIKAALSYRISVLCFVILNFSLGIFAGRYLNILIKGIDLF